MQIAFEANSARRGAGRRPERNDPLPARRRRAGRLGRLEGGEGRDAPGGLPGRRLARDLLRLDRLRPERLERLRRRLRQHQRTAARSAGPPGRDPDLPDHHRPLQVAHLLRPLGPGGEGLQQRPDRAADQDAVARTVLLDGKTAVDQPAGAGRLVRRARRQRRLLRRRLHGLRRDQPRVALAAGGDRDDRDPGPAADPLRRRDQVGPSRPDRAAPAPCLRPDRAGGAAALRPALADDGADRSERAGARRRGARRRRSDRRPARRRQRHRSRRRPPRIGRRDRIARAADRRAQSSPRW